MMQETVQNVVRLVGGPYNGLEVPRPASGASLTIWEDGEPSPGAECARYRPGRDKGTYTYRGKDRLVATLPQVGGA